MSYRPPPGPMRPTTAAALRLSRSPDSGHVTFLPPLIPTAAGAEPLTEVAHRVKDVIAKSSTSDPVPFPIPDRAPGLPASDPVHPTFEGDHIVCGGWGSQEPPTPMVQVLVTSLRDAIERALGASVEELTVESFASQVVAGTNYNVRVRISATEVVTVKFFDPLSGAAVLSAVERDSPTPGPAPDATPMPEKPVSGSASDATPPAHPASDPVHPTFEGDHIVCGGWGSQEPPTPMVQVLVTSLRDAIERALGASVEELTVESFASQVVAGTNYNVRVRISATEVVTVKFFDPLSGAAVLSAVERDSPTPGPTPDATPMPEKPVSGSASVDPSPAVAWSLTLARDSLDPHNTRLYPTDTDAFVRRGASVDFALAAPPGSAPLVGVRVKMQSSSSPCEAPIVVESASASVADSAEFSVSFSLHGATPSGYHASLSIPPSAPVGPYSVTLVPLSDVGDTQDVLELAPVSLAVSLFVVFNAWCPDDVVYLGDADLRVAHLLRQDGLIFTGTFDRPVPRPWTFAQFSPAAATAVARILENVPAATRSDVALLSRELTARVSSCYGLSGVLAGNWSGDYAGGVKPTAWVSSEDILRTWAEQNFTSVKFGQCWVFAGVLCTLMRALGVPTRVDTCFGSSHDVGADGFIDYNINADGTAGAAIGDSIWNFHVWCAAWFQRGDLPDGRGGWQAIDATPQEESDGRMQCGPASLVAIKAGERELGFDTNFVRAEVNADVRYWKDVDGERTLVHTDPSRVGNCVLSEGVWDGAWNNAHDVTLQYKDAELSFMERATARRSLCSGDKISVTLEGADDLRLGLDAVLRLRLTKAPGDKALLTATVRVATYNGSVRAQLASVMKELEVGSDDVLELRVLAIDYVRHMTGTEFPLSVVWSAESGRDIAYHVLPLSFRTGHILRVNVDRAPLSARFSVSNPLAVPLTNARVLLSGAAIRGAVEVALGTVAANGSAEGSYELLAMPGGGEWTLGVLLDTDELHDVRKVLHITQPTGDERPTPVPETPTTHCLPPQDTAPASTAAPISRLIFQLGTNNWQREGEFAPGSGILHEAHHQAYADIPGTASYSIYPSSVQTSSDANVRVLKLDHEIPICESISPVSSYRFHSMSEDVFNAYVARLQTFVADAIDAAEAAEGVPVTIAIAHHSFLNPLVLSAINKERVAQGRPRFKLLCFVHGTALKMFAHEKAGVDPMYPSRFLPMMERAGVFAPDGEVDLCAAISKEQLGKFADVFGSYPVDRMMLSPNGYSTLSFKPDPMAYADRSRLLAEVVLPISPVADAPVRIAMDGIDHLVVFCGKFADWKRLDAVLEAAARYEDGPHGRVATLIIGSGPADAVAHYHDMAYNKLKLKRTYFLGPRPHDEIARFNAMADLGVYPSRNEPFGLVFIECMACGTPVIGTNSGGPRDFVTDEVGCLIPEAEGEELVVALTDAIVQALSWGWKWSKGPAAAEYARSNFSTFRQCRDLLAAIERRP